MTRKPMTISIVLLTTLLACICFAGYARAGVPADAYEPNNTPQTAKAITTGTFALTLGYMGDIDYFNISITAGDKITIDITTDSSIVIQLSGPAGPIKGAGATSSAAGQLVHVATYTGNHTIEATNAVSCEYSLVISITAPSPSTPGYEPVLVLGASLAAVVAAYAFTRSKLRARV